MADASVRSRFIMPTASGQLNGSLDIATPQIVPANPFGPDPYQLKVTASIRVGIPPGRGALLEILYDQVPFSENRYTNGGASLFVATLDPMFVAFVSDQAPHRINVRLTALGNPTLGAVAVDPVGYILIEAQLRAAL